MNCVLDNIRSDPDLWFIKIEDQRRRLTAIDKKYSKEDYKVVAHIINKLPDNYLELITLVKGLLTMIF